MEILGMENKEGGLLGFGLLPRLRTMVSGQPSKQKDKVSKAF
jgi:hypothetical protein